MGTKVFARVELFSTVFTNVRSKALMHCFHMALEGFVSGKHLVTFRTLHPPCLFMYLKYMVYLYKLQLLFQMFNIRNAT